MKSYWIYVQVLGLSICFTFGYQIWADIDIQSCARTLSNSPAFSIRPGYVGEDIELRSQGIPPFSVSKKHQVIYLDEESRKDFLLKFMNNKIRIGEKKFSCKIPFFGCKFIFVVDSHGNIYVGKDILYKFHHSSFLAGRQVIAAGNISLIGDEILSFDNFSGHYHPTSSSNSVALLALLNLGFEPPKKIGYVLRYPGISHGVKVRYLKMKNALEAWQKNKVYTVSGVDAADVEAIRKVLMR